MFEVGEARALVSEVDEQLATVLGVTRALDQAGGLHLGEDLGERTGLDLKAHAELLLGERPPAAVEHA